MYDQNSIFIVASGDQSLWQEKFLEGKVPDRYFYGVNHLERYGFKVFYRKYSPAPRKTPSLKQRLLNATVGRIAKRLESYAGLQVYSSLKQLRFLGNCQFVLTFFENFGLVFGVMKRIGFPLLKKRKIVVVTCWLSHRIETRGMLYRAFVRFAMGGIDCLLVYSRNQIKFISSSLGISEKKILFSPFGVDAEFYRPQKDIEKPAREFVLSVGADSGRNHYDLIAAAERLPEMHFVIVCSSRNAPDASTSIPGNVEIRMDLSHIELRRLYQTCKCGAIITRNYPYPSGSTVLQEMNSMGKTCVITRTDALADFVEHGENALCVELNNIPQIMESLTLLWENDSLRQDMESKASRKAREQFSSRMAMEHISKEVFRLKT